MAHQIFSPFKNLARGSHGFWRGVSWLKKHPRYFLVLFIPMLLGVGAFAGGLWTFIHYGEMLMSMLYLPQGDWGATILRTLLWVIYYVSVFVLLTMGSLIVVTLISSPIYEWVSGQVEKDFRGGVVAELGFWQGVKLLKEELKKGFFILLVPLVLLVVPGISALTAVVAAFLLGWEFYDFPLARRGWGFRARFKFVMEDPWTVLGFGVWLIIPVLHIFFMPMAVVGGTLLNLERLKERGLL